MSYSTLTEAESSEAACPSCGGWTDPTWFCSEGYCPDCCTSHYENEDDDTDQPDHHPERITREGVTLWLRRRGGTWETSADGERFSASPVADASSTSEGAIHAHLFYFAPDITEKEGEQQ